jgi:DNA-directed RNA polymerase subunit RPC12/RpoP
LDNQAILNNAAMSIQVGIEDLAAATPARVLSSVRSLHAGVLLLLKARLLELSPEGSDEVLLKQKLEPRIDQTGKLEFVGTGRKTVEVEEIRQRLTSLGVEVDWTCIKKLTNERNDIEHYHARTSNDALRGIAANVLVIVRDFTTNQLRRDPRVLFGDDAWDRLLANNEVFEAERSECLNAIRAVSWTSEGLAGAIESYTCTECSSQLQRPRDTSSALDELVIECRSCGHEANADEFVEEALRECAAFSSYRAIKNGDRDPIGTCPQCGQEAFIIDEDACARCGSGRTYDRCIRCDAELEIDEQELEGLCGYCTHMTGKDD